MARAWTDARASASTACPARASRHTRGQIGKISFAWGSRASQVTITAGARVWAICRSRFPGSSVFSTE